MGTTSSEADKSKFISLQKFTSALMEASASTRRKPAFALLVIQTYVIDGKLGKVQI